MGIALHDVGFVYSKERSKLFKDKIYRPTDEAKTNNTSRGKAKRRRRVSWHIYTHYPHKTDKCIHTHNIKMYVIHKPVVLESDRNSDPTGLNRDLGTYLAWIKS